MTFYIALVSSFSFLINFCYSSAPVPSCRAHTLPDLVEDEPLDCGRLDPVLESDDVRDNGVLDPASIGRNISTSSNVDTV
jgi:hypothetical protein